MRARRFPAALVALLLIALTVIAFSEISENGFVVIDDVGYVRENPFVRRGLGLEGVRWAITVGERSNWHPLTWLSHMVDVQLFGMNPGAHHLVSLAFHVVNTLLLFQLLRGLTGALWRPSLVAALFAVHPLHVESVAWVAERKDVLSTLFALAAALAYVRAARRGRVLTSAAAPLLFMLALMAKSMPVTLPFLLLLLDWWPLGRWSPTPGAPLRAAPSFARRLPPAALWIEKIPLFLLAASSAVVTLLVQRGASVSLHALPPGARITNAAQSVIGYLRHVLWPVHLAVFYPHPVQVPPWWHTALAVAGITGVSLVGCRLARRRPWFAVGWLWYLGALVPVIGLVQVGAQAMADRYTYLTLTGIFLIAAWVSGEAARRRHLRPPIILAAAALVFILAALTHRQVLFWRDGFTLLEHAMKVTGESAPIHNALGVWFTEQRRYDDARSHFEAAVRLAPANVAHLSNLGQALEALGDFEGAQDNYLRALAIKPNDTSLSLQVEKLAKRWADSAGEGAADREALRSGSARATGDNHFNLGIAFHASGDLPAAEAEYRAALEFNPRDAEALNNLGNILVSRGKPEEALPLFRKAVQIAPANASIHFNLGSALAARDDFEGAVRELSEVVALDPRDTGAMMALGNSLLRLGRREEAAAAYAAARRAEQSREGGRRSPQRFNVLTGPREVLPSSRDRTTRPHPP